MVDTFDGEGLTVTAQAPSWFDTVLTFFRGANGEQSIPEKPTLNGPAVALYKKLVQEELTEMLKGIEEGNIVEAADGGADLIWVVMGLMIAMGIDLRPVWEEVSRTNMAKLGGPRRADGKLLKPLNWKAPDVRGALGRGNLI